MDLHAHFISKTLSRPVVSKSNHSEGYLPRCAGFFPLSLLRGARPWLTLNWPHRSLYLLVRYVEYISRHLLLFFLSVPNFRPPTWYLHCPRTYFFIICQDSWQCYYLSLTWSNLLYVRNTCAIPTGIVKQTSWSTFVLRTANHSIRFCASTNWVRGYTLNPMKGLSLCDYERTTGIAVQKKYEGDPPNWEEVRAWPPILRVSLTVYETETPYYFIYVSTE